MELERFKEVNIPKNTLTAWNKNKDKIIAAFKSSGRTNKIQRIKDGTREKVNITLYKWLPINRQILQEKALHFSKQLNVENFQDSDGWLHAWKARYNISFKEIYVEGKSVTLEMSAVWEETSLHAILSRFCLEDIYNADEFFLLSQGLPKPYT